MSAVEVLIKEFESKALGSERVDLWVPENLTLAERAVSSDVGMAVLLDRILALEFEPEGFSLGKGGRMYHYKRWK